MIIGDRLRILREQKEFSQGEIEKRTGLLRCYISRVENGHTVPAVETLEKFARALEVPLYQLFYDGEKPPRLIRALTCNSAPTCIGSAPTDSTPSTRTCRQPCCKPRRQPANCCALARFSALRRWKRWADGQ